MNTDYKKSLQDIATSVKILSMDAVQKANSGHPGLPMGCAEFGALLYGHVLHHYPKNPNRCSGRECSRTTIALWIGTIVPIAGPDRFSGRDDGPILHVIPLSL